MRERNFAAKTYTLKKGLNLDIDKCISEPNQPFSIWKCHWSSSKKSKFCYKTCQENFILENGMANLTCHVNSGWIKQTIAKCVPKRAENCELARIPSKQYNSTLKITTCSRLKNFLLN